jgi:hypothetical protein
MLRLETLGDSAYVAPCLVGFLRFLEPGATVGEEQFDTLGT